MKTFIYNDDGLVFLDAESASKMSKMVYTYKGISVYSDIYEINEYIKFIKKVIDRAVEPSLMNEAIAYNEKHYNHFNTYCIRIAKKIASLIN